MMPYPRKMSGIHGRKHLAPTKQIPRSSLEELSFRNGSFILQDEFEVLGVVDHDTRRKRRYRDLEGLESKASLTLHEPVEKDTSRCEKLDGIAEDGEAYRQDA